MTTQRKMCSPIHQPLPLTLFVGKEGVSSFYSDIDIFEGILTFGEFVSQFIAEQNSTELNEADKMQRDVNEKDSRVKGIVEYMREGKSIFPSITVFVNSLTIEKNIEVGNRKMVIASLAADADRHITDGQGRFTSASIVIGSLNGDELAEFAAHTISVKFVVTNTATVFDAKKIVRQTFSDYHLSLRKPNTSLSLYFDSATPYGLLMCKLLDSEVCGQAMINWISLKGKITGSQAWTLAQFAAFVHTALGKTKAALNNDLKDPECFNVIFITLNKILPSVLGKLPLESLKCPEKEVKVIRSNALFTKALFLTGLGYLVRSLIEESVLAGNLDLTVFERLTILPLSNLGDESLQKARITDESGKIVSKCDKRIGSYLCRNLRVLHCDALTA